MDMWDILKIEKTKDNGIIKSAYAKLRGTVSSEDAKMLSAAYEFAMRSAKIADSTDSYKEEMLLEMAFAEGWDKNTADDAGTQESSAPGAAESSVFGTFPEFRSLKSSLYDDYVVQMQRVYDNFFVRRELASWEALVLQNAFMTGNKAGLEPVIQEFLTQHRNLPSEVWDLYDREYHWIDKLEDLAKTNRAFVKCLLVETCSRWKLDCAFVTRDSRFDYESYLKFRGLMREAALFNDADGVRKYFDCAIDLYTNDPILYELAADFYSSQPPFNKYGEFGPEFLHALNKLIKIHHNDSKYLMERAEYYKRCEYFDEAREDYEQAMKLTPEDLRIPYEIADSFNLENVSGKAKSYFKYIKKVYQKTQADLEKRMAMGKDRDRISAIIDSNDLILAEVFEQLK